MSTPNLTQLSEGPNQVADSLLDFSEAEIVLDLPQPRARVDVWLIGTRLADVIADICYGSTGK